MKIAQIENLSFSYNGKSVLKGLSFHLDESDFLSVLGGNGAGKSTILKIISKTIPFFEGDVKIAGKKISEYSNLDFAKMAAYVPSEIFVPYDFAVSDIVVMGRSPYIKWWRSYSVEDEKFAYEILEKMKIGNLAERKLNSLSSGEKQLVFIAQALAQSPKFIILDEPTSHLDIKYKIEVFDILDKMRKENSVSVIAATHDLNLAKAYSKKILLLNKGETVYFGGSGGMTKKHALKAYDLKKLPESII